MKIIPLLLMLVFIVVPCSANTDIYSVQYADANGVYTGNTDIVKCTIGLYDKDKPSTASYLVDLCNGTFKVVEIDGKDVRSQKDNNWSNMGYEKFNDVAQYVKDNHSNILQYSRNNPQCAYRVN